MNNPTKIELSEAEAKHWILFQQHFGVFEILLENGVFVQKSASVTLNFDHNGVLQTVERKDTMYSARFPKISTSKD